MLHRSRQGTSDVDMIRGSPDLVGRTMTSTACCCQVGVKLVRDFGINEWVAVLCTENNMDEHIGQ